jgi:hypothetical protein
MIAHAEATAFGGGLQAAAIPAKECGAFTHLLEKTCALGFDFSSALEKMVTCRPMALPQLQLALEVVRSGSAPNVHSSIFLTALNELELPFGGLRHSERDGLIQLVRASPTDTATWIAALRWWSPGKYICMPNTPTPVKKWKEYEAALLAFQASQHDDSPQQLSHVLIKLLRAAPPRLEVLGKLFTVEWSVGTRVTREKCTVDDLFLRPAGPYKNISALKQAHNEAWDRCVAPCCLTELVELLSAPVALPGVGEALRRAACNPNCWSETNIMGHHDAPRGVVVEGIERLGFGSNEKPSNELLRRLRDQGSLTQLCMFPHLLPVLALPDRSRSIHTQECVKSFVKRHENNGEGICQLYLWVAKEFESWGGAVMAEALASLRTTTINLHRQHGFGGGEALLDAAQRLGDCPTFLPTTGDTADGPASWLILSIREYLKVRVGSDGERAATVVELVAKSHKHAAGRWCVPHALSQQVVVHLLDVLVHVVPKEELCLLKHLMQPDQLSFWQRMLAVTGTADSIRANSLFTAVRGAVLALSSKLLDRSVTLECATILLPAARRSGYKVLTNYASIVGRSELQPSTCSKVLADVETLQRTHEALNFFQLEFCNEANDVVDGATLTEELARVRHLDVALRDAETEKHWGATLVQVVREAAATCFRLGGSQLFRSEWKKAMAQCSYRLTVTSLATDVCFAAVQSFSQQGQLMLGNDRLKLCQVCHIFDQPPRTNEAAQHFITELRTELRIMFPEAPDKVQVRELEARLGWFAKMVTTLQNASALVGVAKNVLENQNKVADVGCELLQLASQLIEFGHNQQSELLVLATLSEQFEALLEPYTEALAAADQLGLADGLLCFLKEVVNDDDDLHDLAQEAEEQAELGDAVLSLFKVRTVLKPLIEKPPTVLHGETGGALERLQEQLRNNSMRGMELQARLAECSAHLQALRQTYNNLTKKGEQSKETRRGIVERGAFVFSATGQAHVLCDGTRIDQARLRELRSHALLEINSKQGESGSPAAASEQLDRERLESFLEMTMLVSLISSSISRLAELGYFEPSRFEQTVHDIVQLRTLQEQVSTLCNSWDDAVSTARQENYILSFFCSQQLQQLFTMLCTGQPPSHLLQFVPASSMGKRRGPSQDETTASVKRRALPEVTSDVIDLTADDDEQVNALQQIHEARSSATATSPALTRLAAMRDAANTSDENRLRALGEALQEYFQEAAPRRHAPTPWIQRRAHPKVAMGELAVYFVRPATSRCSNMLETCLALYAADGEMPEHAQLLFCRADTSREEIDAFLHRAFHADQCALVSGRLFCAIRISALTQATYLYLKERVQRLYDTTNPKHFRIALLCEEAERRRVWSDLMAFEPRCEIEPLTAAAMKEVLAGARHVVVVHSTRAGLGKTQRIHQLKQHRRCQQLRTVAISGLISREELVRELRDQLADGKCDVLHLNVLDVPASCAELVNDMLFELLCLSMVSSSAASNASIVNVPCATVFVELANVLGTPLLQKLPLCGYFKQEVLSWDQATNPPSFTGPDEQLVCAYLHALEHGMLETDDFDRQALEDHTQRGRTPAPLAGLLDAPRRWQLLSQHFLLRNDVNVQMMSWAQLHVFLGVLAQQLRCFRVSQGFANWLLREIAPGHTTVRSIVVRCLVEASARLAMRAVDYVDAATDDANEDDARCIERRLHCQSFEDVQYALLLMQKAGGMAPFPNAAVFGANAAVVSHYYSSVTRQLPNYRELTQEQLLTELCNFFVANADVRAGELQETAVWKVYTLNADNLLKMMLVHVRLSSSMPVIVSGETGCGKTTLLKFLAYVKGLPDANFQVLNVHAGISKMHIYQFVKGCEEQAARTGHEVWCFFDEANTSLHTGVLSELVCRRVLGSRRVSRHLRFLAAVNPHRLRKRAVESIGLQSKLNTEDPMRHLVYRVHPLPEAMLDYVWDYGRLSDTDEASYIKNMLRGLFESVSPQLYRLGARLVVQSHQFIRNKEEDCSVSLRDVRRFRRLAVWFHETRAVRAKDDAVAGDGRDGQWWLMQNARRYFRRTQSEYVRQRRPEEQAILLALAHCYYCRLPSSESRAEYRALVCEEWRVATQDRQGPQLKPDEFVEVVEAEQREYLHRMVIPKDKGVALNGALLENVFVLLVCILNRMPVFLVGKPGCSKSLAMQLIFANLRGLDSDDAHFKTLPRLIEFRYQCSEDSTSAGIRAVFDSARRVTAKNGDAIAVVLLDEIGLAEVSRHNPLKVLHDLIEPDAREELASLAADGTPSQYDLPYAVGTYHFFAVC